MMWIKEVVELVGKLVPKHLSKVRTNIPAQVVSYDPATNTCSVQPCIMQIRTDDPNNLEPLALPQCDDIPVKLMGSGKLFFSITPAVGSYGELRIFDRDISKFLQEGGQQSPGSTRKFHFSDGIFDPGVYPLKADENNGLIEVPLATDRIGMRSRDGNSEISLLDDGEILLKSGTASIVLPLNGTCTINDNFTVDI